MAPSLVYVKTATIPAGTPQASPALVDVSFDAAAVSVVTVTVPPGPLGLMGFQLWVKGGQAIPANQGAYVVADNRVITWQLANLPDSGAWQVKGYNLDIYDHTIHLEFSVEPVGAIGQPVAGAATDTGLADILALGGG